MSNSNQLMGREELVMPGHPLVLAMFVMDKFDSIETAVEFADESLFCRALDNDAVPGRADQICHALRILEDLKDSSQVCQAPVRADTMWRSDDSIAAEVLEAGSRQALQLEKAFLAKVVHWRALKPAAQAA